ncbi:hypothetical protein WISP_02761 [Willisornis vidua]|uniref:Uncharacterized protein n=1 Tax=Willisornis vidua TaxID=1566151 RepID=A0ABQ9DUJ6_9PASS|nr:hypothetical protein WISP_02761 [Willisornis vidua]
MEKTKAKQEFSSTQPIPPSQPSASPPHSNQPLATRFVPVVVHSGGLPLSSSDFVFYRRAFSNSLAPFYTVQRPYCGYQFREDTNHSRTKTDLENADLMKWRPIRSRRL